MEVITAEDIGKMPDKNVADSLSRVPGVTISSASANEGGFDENDRVSMRGTNPSLTQTLINGHNVAAGDWFVLNQVAAGRPQRQLHAAAVGARRPGRRAQELAGLLVEGGVAGSVDIITRKPLDFSEQLTIGGVGRRRLRRAAGRDRPADHALFNWKNDADTFGVLLQAFSEKRHLRRDGVESWATTRSRRAARSHCATPTSPA